MTFPNSNPRSLVDLANDQTLLIYAMVLGDEDGPPLWVQLTADATDKRPASRMTVVRAEGEDCASLWARVLSAVRQLKKTRGFQHRVIVHCRITQPPADLEQADRRFNMVRALWHDADHERDPLKRVSALCTLADVIEHRGKLPAFQ